MILGWLQAEGGRPSSPATLPPSILTTFRQEFPVHRGGKKTSHGPQCDDTPALCPTTLVSADQR